MYGTVGGDAPPRAADSSDAPELLIEISVKPPPRGPAAPAASASDVAPSSSRSDLFLETPAEVEADRAAARKKQRNIFIPVVCSIFGVIIFMRLGVLVGTLGLLYAWLVIAAAFAITLLTIGSVSALASASFTEYSQAEHVDISGSFYKLIRRSLGRHLGQLIGVMLYMSFAVATAYYLLGFSEITMFYMGIFATTHTLPWSADGSWVTVIIASTLLALFTFSYSVGVKPSRRVVRFVFIAVLVAVACNILFLLVTNPDTHTGFSVAHLHENARLDTSSTHLIAMFSTCFPAFCGVLAGTSLAENISVCFPYPVSSLTSPASMAAKQPRQLVLGVHKALFFSFFVYVVLSFVLAASVDNATLHQEALIVPVVVDSILGIPLVYIGIVFATLSSALSNIMGGSSILKTLLLSANTAEDASTDDAAASPATTMTDRTRLIRASSSRRSLTSSTMELSSSPSSSSSSSPSSTFYMTLLTWTLSQAAIMCGTVDAILPLVTAAFLLTFFVLNFACFFQDVSSSTFNPTFRMYSRWTALLGAVLSLVAFFLVISTILFVVVGVFVVGYATFYRDELPSLVERMYVEKRHARRTHVTQPMRSGSFLDTIVDENGEIIAPLTSLISPKVGAKDDEGDTESEKKRFELAAQYVRDAIHGRFLGEEYLIEGLHKTHFKRMYHALSFVRTANMAILLALAFFETPSWCFFAANCGDPTRVLTWELPVLSQQTTIAIELVCLSLLAIEMTLKYTYMGQRLYFVNKWHVMQLICLLADFASVLIVVFVPEASTAAATHSVEKYSHLREEIEGMKPLVLAPLIRPILLLSMSHKLRSGFSSLVRALPRFADGLLTITVLIVIYAVCGMVLFEGTDEGTTYFNNFPDACLNLLILLTTANFPDVMMPIYSQVRAGSLFFVSFLMVGQLLVMNLVFASVYQNYRQEVAQRAMDYVEQRFQALQVAFQLLPETVDDEDKADTFGDDKVITRAVYERLLSEILRPAFSLFHDTKKLNKKKNKSVKKNVGFMRLVSDIDEQNGITFEQFFLLIKGFAARQKSAQKKPKKVLKRQNTLRVVSWMQSAVEKGWFDTAVDGLILVNLFTILVETQAKIAREEGAYLTWERWMPLFSAAYLVEMCIKMYFYGFGRYFDQLRNVYDCVVTIIISIAEVSIRVHYGDAMGWEWVRFLLLLRFLRCLRLLVALKSLSSMFAIVVRLIPAFTTLYGMLGIVLAEYAAIGMQVFGGKLVLGDPRLARITYGTANYYSNNFNDFASSLVTLFELLIVNNWYVTMEGAEVVTSKWSRIYFISFYIIGVVMVLSLVVAFVVEAYFEDAASTESKTSAPMSGSSSTATNLSLNRSSSSSVSEPPRDSSRDDHDHSMQQRLVRRKSLKLCPRADSIYVEDFL
ncbi:Two pore calcium channel protein 1, partial [Globisporangium splendens]